MTPRRQWIMLLGDLMEGNKVNLFHMNNALVFLLLVGEYV